MEGLGGRVQDRGFWGRWVWDEGVLIKGSN